MMGRLYTLYILLSFTASEINTIHPHEAISTWSAGAVWNDVKDEYEEKHVNNAERSAATRLCEHGKKAENITATVVKPETVKPHSLVRATEALQTQPALLVQTLKTIVLMTLVLN